MKSLSPLPILLCLVLAWPTLVLAQGGTALLWVENRAGAAYADSAATLPGLLAGRLADAGLRTVDAATATATLGAGRTPTAAVDPTLGGESALLRLAQTLNADYVFLATLTSVGSEEITSSAYGVSTANTVTKATLAYRVLQAADGATLLGDTVEVARRLRSAGATSTVSTTIVAELLNEAAQKAAGAFANRQNAAARAGTTALAAPTERTQRVTFTVAVALQDALGQPVAIPDVVRQPDGTYQVTANRLPLAVTEATVELNGVVIGSAPGSFEGLRGLNRLRLTREGCVPYTANVNLSEGFKLRVGLRLTEEAYARVKDSLEFLAALENEKKLTEAEAERLRGAAEMLRNSAIRFDRLETLTVGDRALSLFGGVL